MLDIGNGALGERQQCDWIVRIEPQCQLGVDRRQIGCEREADDQQDEKSAKRDFRNRSEPSQPRPSLARTISNRGWPCRLVLSAGRLVSRRNQSCLPSNRNNTSFRREAGR